MSDLNINIAHKVQIDTQMPIAKESYKITKAREKLEKRLKAQDRLVTQEKLKQKMLDIHNKIARQSALRTFVKKGSLSLFDNNKNPAEISIKVAKLAKVIFERTKTFFKSDDKESSLKNKTIEAR